MDSIKEFLQFIYNGVMAHSTLVICILITILLIRIVSDNFILLLLLFCLLSIVYKDKFNIRSIQNLNRYRRPVMTAIQQEIELEQQLEKEGFDGSDQIKYFNPVNSYNVADPGIQSVYWPLRYTYD